MSYPDREPPTTGSIYVPAPEQPFTLQQMTQPAAARKRGPLPLLLGLIVALVLVSAGLAVYLVAFRSVTIRGTLTVGAAGTGFGGAGGSECHGTGPYADLVKGATVEITDGAGKTIALGQLGPGKVVNQSDCLFAFAVEAPRSDIYGVQVSHRGVLKYSRAEAQAGVALTIGT